MENITVGQIASAIGVITVIAGFCVALFKWYKFNITDKFASVDKKINEVTDRLENVENYVENKEKEFLKELDDSKFERKILMGGLLSALKGLSKMGCTDDVTGSINEIQNYMMNKTHD